jgi:hypothetical protein
MADRDFEICAFNSEESRATEPRSAQCLSWVNGRKAQPEQMFSASPPTASRRPPQARAPAVHLDVPGKRRDHELYLVATGRLMAGKAACCGATKTATSLAFGFGRSSARSCSPLIAAQAQSVPKRANRPNVSRAWPSARGGSSLLAKKLSGYICQCPWPLMTVFTLGAPMPVARRKFLKMTCG